MILADIASGETDVADVLFLIAVILFAVAAVLAFQVKTLWAALVSCGLTATALAWLLL